MEKIERYRGAMLGLAVGGAMGAAVEFLTPGTFEPVTEMLGGGPHGLKPGQWTDDTSMALCLAESLIARNGFDPADQMERYLRWYREGHLSSDGRCFDIGDTTRRSLEHFERTREPYSGVHEPNGAGNGSIMRLAPIPLAFADTPCKAIYLAGKSSLTTHGSQCAADACRLLAQIIIRSLSGSSRASLLGKISCWAPDGSAPDPPLCTQVQALDAGSFRAKNPPDIRASGFSVSTLEAALWAFNRASTFEEGMVAAVNLGEDADTVGAVYGQIAGAFFGEKAIPERWIRRLAMKDFLVQTADRLYEMAS